MKMLVFKSWLLLLYFEFIMKFRGFKTLHEIVGSRKLTSTISVDQPSAAELCHAVDLACVLYFKEVLCLQRSAVTTVLLRWHGWKAEMVIGAQIFPFKFHAWVEIGSEVISDKPYMLEIYRVLERC